MQEFSSGQGAHLGRAGVSLCVPSSPHPPPDPQSASSGSTSHAPVGCFCGFPCCAPPLHTGLESRIALPLPWAALISIGPSSFPLRCSPCVSEGLPVPQIWIPLAQIHSLLPVGDQSPPGIFVGSCGKGAAVANIT